MNYKKSTIGVFLIVLGLVIALGNLNMVPGLITLPLISVGFFFLYFYFGAWSRRGNIGFLIPGCIIAVVGIFAILETNGYIYNGFEPIFLVMLGVAFLIIMLVHTIRIDSPRWGERYWPIFPAAVLILIGAIALITTSDSTIAGLITPAILILVGIYILFKPLLKPKFQKKRLDD
jgi:hypothetical protein